MTSRRRDDPECQPALRDGSLGAARRRPRELYEARPVQVPARVGTTSSPDTSSATPFQGEFEQRAAGAQGQGPGGHFGSDQTLREQLCQRIADDPRLAGVAIEVSVDEQVLTLSGSVPDAQARDLLLEHAVGLGLSSVRDELRVAAPAARTGRRR
jgi:hypothetical protein